MRRVVPCLLAILFAAAPARSDDKKPETGTVSGVVTYKGQPLAKGTVTFQAANGKVFNAATDAQGRYSVKGVPAGELKVGIKAAAPVPAKYADPKTSGLTFRVEKGEQTIDIALQ
jgi:Carboxypeptidase regulatory-like domain